MTKGDQEEANWRGNRKGWFKDKGCPKLNDAATWSAKNFENNVVNPANSIKEKKPDEILNYYYYCIPYTSQVKIFILHCKKMIFYPDKLEKLPTRHAEIHHYWLLTNFRRWWWECRPGFSFALNSCRQPFYFLHLTPAG